MGNAGNVVNGVGIRGIRMGIRGLGVGMRRIGVGMTRIRVGMRGIGGGNVKRDKNKRK